MQTLEGDGDGPNNWFSATHVGNLELVPSSQLGPPVGTIVGICGVGQWASFLSLCLPLK